MVIIIKKNLIKLINIFMSINTMIKEDGYIEFNINITLLPIICSIHPKLIPSLQSEK